MQQKFLVPDHKVACFFFISDHVTGMCFLVDTNIEVSIIPVSNISGKRKETLVFLQAINHLPIQTFDNQFLTLDLRLCCTFQWMFVIAKLPAPISGADFMHHFSLFVDLKHNRLVGTTTQLTVHSVAACMTTVSPTLLQMSTTHHSAILKDYPVFYNQQIKHDVSHHIKTCLYMILEAQTRSPQSHRARVPEHAGSQDYVSVQQQLVLPLYTEFPREL